ncbi:MAG: TOMM precursor leader peptide-binding protein [Rikenellaceae bacterium]
MKNKIILSPIFAQCTDKDGSLILVSNNRIIRLQYKMAKELLPLLDGSRSEDEVVDELMELFPLAELYYTIRKLIAANAILFLPSGGATTQEVFNAVIGGDNRATPELVFVNLSAEYVESGRLLSKSFEWDAKTSYVDNYLDIDLNDESIYIVVTPSYLEPKLLEFNRVANAKKLLWLPVKITGEEFYAGPLFGNSELGCMECVATQNRMHHSYLPQKPFYSRYAVRFFASLIECELRRFASGASSRLESGVIAQNFVDNTTTYHIFKPTNSCPICGVNQKSLCDSKPDFKSRPKIGYVDGGDRIISAKESLKRFLPLVSPITGVVSSLKGDERWSDSNGGYWLSSAKWGCVNSENSVQSEDGKQANHRDSRVNITGCSAGKGRSEEQAHMSAIGEAMERYSTQYFGYEKVINASYDQLGASRAIEPRRLANFSKRQFANREHFVNSHFGKIPHPYPTNEKIDWVECYSLIDKKYIYIPAAYAFYSYPKDYGVKYIYCCSNGVSGGNCIEEAFLQGAYELFERDGVALWWYNFLQRPALDLEAFADKKMRQFINTIRSKGDQIYALDFTPDRPGIPVIGVVIMPKDVENKTPSFGFGAHLDVHIALDRAFSEVVQCQGFAGKMEADEEDWWGLLKDREQTAFLSPSNDPLRRPEDFPKLTTDTLLGDIELIISRLEECSMDCYIHNLTREETSFSVCRVIITDLLHFWYRFGNKRIFNAPVEFGWSSAPLCEEQLNQICFPL